jgi:hypothetical protein
MAYVHRTAEQRRSESKSNRIAAVIAVAALVPIGIGAFYAWQWFESYRASIWAAEMRKAGVAAPSEVR